VDVAAVVPLWSEWSENATRTSKRMLMCALRATRHRSLMCKPERWNDGVKNAARACEAETDDVGWSHLTPHDFRRTWGTLLVESEVEPGMVMEWDGWEDWETFREHYLGAYSAEMQRQQLEKVDWL
jgi:integrase